MTRPHEKETPVSPARRKALSWGLWTILGIIGAAGAWPVVELATRHKVKKKELVFFDAVPADEMPEVGIKKAELSLHGGERPDARVFIKRDAGGGLTAFSAICTHLGCLVSFNRIKGEFICPCHGGKYDMDGNVTAGPPPAPLARLPVRLTGGYVQVGFRV